MENKLKIAFLCNANNPHVIARARYFVQRGHDVFYFGLPPEGEQELSLGIQYYPLISSRWLSRIPILKVLRFTASLRQLTKKHKIDLLHVMWMPYSINVPFLGLKEVVIENMGSDVLIMPQNSLLIRVLYKWLYPFAKAVIQDSQIAKDASIQYGAKNQINEVIEVGIDFKIFNREREKGVARKRLNLKNDQQFVFSPRSFTDLYNIETIIKSIPIVKKIFSDVKYVFCRFSGDIEGKYLELINELGVTENIIYAGFLDNEKELPYYFTDADMVLSVPSSDSSPRTVYEAMACGCPVIISELPWYYGKLKENKHIKTVPVQDVDQLSFAIIDILDKKDLPDTNSAFEFVYQNINFEVENSKLEKIYRKILPAERTLLQ